MLESDGVIVQSDHAYEGDTIKAYSNWIQKERNIDLYALSFPPNPDQLKPGSEVEEVQKFLDSALKKFGEKSMFFVSKFQLTSFFVLNRSLPRYHSDLLCGLFSPKRFGRC